MGSTPCPPTTIMFGSLFRLAIDALLLSAFLAGIRRATGLTYVCRRHRCARSPPTDRRYHKYRTRTFAVSSIFVRQCCLIRPQNYSGHISSVVRLALYTLGIASHPSRRVCFRLCRGHIWGDPARSTTNWPANFPCSVPVPSNASSRPVIPWLVLLL